MLLDMHDHVESYQKDRTIISYKYLINIMTSVDFILKEMTVVTCGYS